uniref:ABC transporter permease n=1 Tax=Ignisphaera aggregans TaxID=334771 RepID=A0A7C4FGI8_9CREN
MMERLKSFLNAIKTEIWSQPSGKAALTLLALLIVLSIISVAMLPQNFVTVWNDPKPWGIKPKNVPPQWVKFFGAPCVQHYEVDLRSSRYALGIRGNEVLLSYTLTYELNGDGFPQGIAVKIDGLHLTGTQSVRIALNITRPDGVTVPAVLTHLVTAINGSISIESAVLNPDIMKLATTLVALYPQLLSVASLNDIAMNYPKYLFGVLTNASNVSPLNGAYKVELLVAVAIPRVISVADVNTIASTVRNLRDFRFIVIGTCYGVLGTDYRGRDIGLALFFGLPIALLIGIGTAVFTTLIGLFAGLVSGYYGGIVDEVIQRFIDVLGSIPLLPILILIAVAVQQAYGASPYKPIIMLLVILGTLVVFGWGGLAIVVRSMTLSIKSEAYIEAAKVTGASNWWIMIKHIIPQLLPYIAAQMVYSAPTAILTEAGLSILGIQHGLPTWGGILADARVYGNISYWWWIFPPGIAISITSLTFVLLGLSLEKVVEPRLGKV